MSLKDPANLIQRIPELEVLFLCDIKRRAVFLFSDGACRIAAANCFKGPK